MAGLLGFPTNPTTGTTYTIGQNTWIWNGAAWISYASSTSSGVTVTTATSSQSTTTGALVVTGGLGISGGVNISGTATINGANILTTSSGTLQEVTNVGNSTTNQILFLNTSASVSTTTGAVTVVGGVGVGGNVFANSFELPYSLFTTNTVSNTLTSLVLIDSYPISTYRCAKYVVQIDDPPNYEALEILTLHNGASVAVATEYGKIYNNYDLGAWTVSIVSSNLNLYFQANTATNKTITFLRTALTA